MVRQPQAPGGQDPLCHPLPRADGAGGPAARGKKFQHRRPERKDEILFLRKIVPGGADQSYGIEVAGLAGLPPKVIRRAREILAELESQQDAPKKTGAREASQVSLTALGEEEVLTTLRNTPVETLTPLQALNLLHELKEKL